MATPLRSQSPVALVILERLVLRAHLENGNERTGPRAEGLAGPFMFGTPLLIRFRCAWCRVCASAGLSLAVSICT